MSGSVGSRVDEPYSARRTYCSSDATEPNGSGELGVEPKLLRLSWPLSSAQEPIRHMTDPRQRRRISSRYTLPVRLTFQVGRLLLPEDGAEVLHLCGEGGLDVCDHDEVEPGRLGRLASAPAGRGAQERLREVRDPPDQALARSEILAKFEEASWVSGTGRREGLGGPRGGIGASHARRETYLGDLSREGVDLALFG